MSLEAMVDAWRHSRAKKSARLVMLALANEVRPKHNMPICWPGKGSLAKQTRLNERTVDHKIDELAALKEIIVVPDGDIDVFVKQSIEKIHPSNLYILCPGHSESTIARVLQRLRGGQNAPRQDAPRIPGHRGGASTRQGGGHLGPHRTGDSLIEPEKKNRREIGLFDAPPDWAAPGVRAVFERDGKRFVGEIVERPDGRLAFRSAQMPWTTMPIDLLVGHITPITGPPDLAGVEESGS